MTEEPIIPFLAPRAEIPSATRFRSTWVVSSLQSLRSSNYYERYVGLVAAEHRTTILESVAGVWLPMAVARAHYEACNKLGLTFEGQLAIGRDVGKRAHGTLLGTVVKAARGVGVTPWTIFPHFHRIWLRGVDGGGAAVFRLGPKEARVEFVGCELLDIPYFRNALRGVILGNSALFCQRGYVHELPTWRRGDVALRIQWA